MQKLLYSLLYLVCSANADYSSMDCGSAPYCGVLVFDLGGGSENPFVNGLWPETGLSGNSKCVSPGGNPGANIPDVACYTDKDLQKSEWQSHGICASNIPEMYFVYVCNLSTIPLNIITSMKQEGHNINDIAKNLEFQNYEVYNIDVLNNQLELSICAGLNTVWIFSSVKNFGAKCGTGLNKNLRAPSPILF